MNENEKENEENRHTAHDKKNNEEDNGTAKDHRSNDEPPSIEEVRLPGGGAGKDAPAKRSTNVGRYFLKGPIPLWWLMRAAQCPGSALAVAIVVRFLTDLHRGGPIRLTRTYFAPFGLTRHSVSRGLRELVAARLVVTRVNRGSSPVVRVVLEPTADDLAFRFKSPELDLEDEDDEKD